MPLPLVIGGAILGEEAIAALIVWGGRLLALGVGAAIANEATKEKETPATDADTTTIVGKGTMRCGDSGKYDDMLKQTGDGKLDRDHVPSKAALQKAAEKLLEAAEISLSPAQKKALFGDNGLISKQGQTIAIPKKDHQQHSETYGRRNNPEKIDKDSGDLQKAAERDTKTIEDAEGKEMDDECAKKYKKAADEIRKKTHDEYMQDIKNLIKDVMKNVK